jgi:hypothetical protein
MPNRIASLVGNGCELFVVASLAFACSKDKHEEASVAASSQAPVASSPAPEAPPAASAALTKIDPDAAKSVEKACAGICERSRSLKCKNAEECMKSCIGMGIGTPCSEAFAALYACLGSQPAERWECGEDGMAAIREGFCEKEQERTVKCMEAKSQP